MCLLFVSYLPGVYQIGADPCLDGLFLHRCKRSHQDGNDRQQAQRRTAANDYLIDFIVVLLVVIQTSTY